MINNRTTLLMTSLIAALSFNANASEKSDSEEVNPADVTRAYTQVYFGINNKSETKLYASRSMTFDGGTSAMVSAETTLDNKGDYADSRFQYFHVFNTGSTAFPRLATSLDIIDNDSFTTAAFGAATIWTTPFESFNMFARGAGLVGEYSDKFAADTGITNKEITGGMGALYFVWNPLSDGTFLAVYPEYTSLSGDADIEQLKWTATAGVPITDAGDKWIQIKYENTNQDISTRNRTLSESDTTIWTQFKMYF
ncbi:hypothetical protein F7U66_18755 [Vibrio parahaemolyticus]|nr:hypothetical protein [Vibrio parahaemolyticus]